MYVQQWGWINLFHLNSTVFNSYRVPESVGELLKKPQMLRILIQRPLLLLLTALLVYWNTFPMSYNSTILKCPIH